MGPDLSHATAFFRFPRLLIAENNCSTVESLIRTICDTRLGIDCDVCTSHRQAVRKLLASPYQLIVSGVHLAEIDDFLLLKCTQTLHAFVPFVVTAEAQYKESTRRIVGQGAYDFITTPLEHEQTVHTILLALWQSKLMTLIRCKERALDAYREHVAAYPSGNQMDERFTITISAIQDSILSYQ